MVRARTLSAVSEKNMIKRLLQNVDSIKGVSNNMVDSFCRSLCLSNIASPYKGVFAADEIPVKRLCGETNFNIVVNLATRESASDIGHFITIHARNNIVFYIDPTGIPCLQHHVRDFLKSLARPLFFNTRKIQNIVSSFCAMYAILYIYYFNEERPSFKIIFAGDGERANDQKCVAYLHQLIDSSK